MTQHVSLGDSLLEYDNDSAQQDRDLDLHTCSEEELRQAFIEDVVERVSSTPKKGLRYMSLMTPASQSDVLGTSLDEKIFPDFVGVNHEDVSYMNRDDMENNILGVSLLEQNSEVSESVIGIQNIMKSSLLIESGSRTKDLGSSLISDEKRDLHVDGTGMSEKELLIGDKTVDFGITDLGSSLMETSTDMFDPDFICDVQAIPQRNKLSLAEICE